MAKLVPCYNKGCGQMFEEEKNNDGKNFFFCFFILMPTSCKINNLFRTNFPYTAKLFVALQNHVDIIQVNRTFTMLTKVGRVARRKVSTLPSFLALKVVHWESIRI